MIPTHISLDMINGMSKNTLMETLHIEFVEVSESSIKAKMPVRPINHQPMGLLHGGASVALAETIGSTGTYLCLEPTSQSAVGLEINANHIGGIKEGYVIGTGTLVHKGRSTHIWNIEIRSEKEDKLICTSRLTMMIINKK